MRTKFGFERNRDTLNEVFNSRQQNILSGYDILNVGDKIPAGNLVFYQICDGKRLPYMTEEYAIVEGGYDKDYLLRNSKNGEFVRMEGFKSIIDRLVNNCGLGEEYIDQIEYSIKGNEVEFTVYPTERGINLLNNGWWDDYSVKWALSADEQVPLWDGDDKVAMNVELRILGLKDINIQSSYKPIKSSLNIEQVANEMVQKLKNRGINATVEEDRFEGTDCYRISLSEGNSLTKQNANNIFFDFVDEYEKQGIAFEKDSNGTFYGEDFILMNGEDWWIDSSVKKPIKSGYVIKVTETDDDYTYSPTYVNGNSWQSKEPQIFETEEDAQEQAEDFRKYLNKRVRSLGGRWQYKLEVVKSSCKEPIKSGISSEQNKFNWAYNDWFGHFQMNLDRVPQYLEGVKWCDANKGTSEYEQLCKEYNCYPVGDREKASFYNALKQVGAITSSKKLIKSAYSTKVDRLIDEMYEQHFITEEDLNAAKQKKYTDEEINQLEKNYIVFRNTISWDDMKRVIKDTVRIISPNRR